MINIVIVCGIMTSSLLVQVYDRFPGIDLQPRRPFVKKKVKEVGALLCNFPFFAV